MCARVHIRACVHACVRGVYNPWAVVVVVAAASQPPTVPCEQHEAATAFPMAKLAAVEAWPVSSLAQMSAVHLYTGLCTSLYASRNTCRNTFRNICAATGMDVGCGALCVRAFAHACVHAWVRGCVSAGASALDKQALHVFRLLLRQCCRHFCQFGRASFCMCACVCTCIGACTGVGRRACG